MKVFVTNRNRNHYRKRKSFDFLVWLVSISHIESRWKYGGRLKVVANEPSNSETSEQLVTAPSSETDGVLPRGPAWTRWLHDIYLTNCSSELVDSAGDWPRWNVLICNDVWQMISVYFGENREILGSQSVHSFCNDNFAVNRDFTSSVYIFTTLHPILLTKANLLP